MTLTVVESSAFTHMGYDESKCELVVQFNNGEQFVYENVPAKLYALLQSVSQSEVSIGSALHWLVKAHPTVYHFKKLRRKMPCG